MAAPAGSAERLYLTADGRRVATGGDLREPVRLCLHVLRHPTEVVRLRPDLRFGVRRSVADVALERRRDEIRAPGEHLRMGDDVALQRQAILQDVPDGAHVGADTAHQLLAVGERAFVGRGGRLRARRAGAEDDGEGEGGDSRCVAEAGAG